MVVAVRRGVRGGSAVWAALGVAGLPLPLSPPASSFREPPPPPAGDVPALGSQRWERRLTCRGGCGLPQGLGMKTGVWGRKWGLSYRRNVTPSSFFYIHLFIFSSLFIYFHLYLLFYLYLYIFYLYLYIFYLYLLFYLYSYFFIFIYLFFYLYLFFICFVFRLFIYLFLNVCYVYIFSK